MILSEALFILSAFRLTSPPMVLPVVMLSALRCMVWDSLMGVRGKWMCFPPVAKDLDVGCYRLFSRLMRE